MLTQEITINKITLRFIYWLPKTILQVETIIWFRINLLKESKYFKLCNHFSNLHNSIYKASREIKWMTTWTFKAICSWTLTDLNWIQISFKAKIIIKSFIWISINKWLNKISLKRCKVHRQVEILVGTMEWAS